MYIYFKSLGSASQAPQRMHFRAAVLYSSQEVPVAGHITEEALPSGGVAKHHDHFYHPSPG